MAVFGESERVAVAATRRRQSLDGRRDGQPLRTKLVGRVAQSEPAIATLAAAGNAAVVVKYEGAVLASLHLVKKEFQ